MTLTAAVFQQILSSLKSDTGRRFNEQRNSPRVGVRGKISILPLTHSQEPLEVWVRDVSVTGIGLLSPQNFAPGTRLLARFPKVDDAPLAITYVVAHCKSVSRGLFVVGARLAELPPKRRTPTSPAKSATPRPPPTKAGAPAKPAPTAASASESAAPPRPEPGSQAA